MMMNQDQVKERLLQIFEPGEDFTLLFSGKESSKVNGLYKPESREIVIHNRNFEDDNSLLYTAIHEFAHHVHFCSPNPPKSSKSHTKGFRKIFHDLLQEAERKGVYQNRIGGIPELFEIERRIKDEYISKHGALFKELGQLLIDAEGLCRKHGVRFEDFIERNLQLNKAYARSAMTVKAQDLPAEIGEENMKIVSRLKDPGQRQALVQSFQQGESQDQVREKLSEGSGLPREVKGFQGDEKIVGKLEEEIKRIDKTIDNLTKRKREMEHKLEKARMEAGV
jgi:hypothetical protein